MEFVSALEYGESDLGYALSSSGCPYVVVLPPYSLFEYGAGGGPPPGWAAYVSVRLYADTGLTGGVAARRVFAWLS